MTAPKETTRNAASRCLCDEAGLLGLHETPCAGYGSRSDELCEQAEREAVAAGNWTYSEEAVSPRDPILLPSKIKGWIEVLETCLPTDEGYDDDTEQVLGNVIRSMRKAVA